ncbi:MAG: SH3 domain-containing protein [Aureispira sp.]
MKPFLLLLLLMLVYPVWAQDEEPEPLHRVTNNSLVAAFEVGTTTYLLADRVNIRTTPSSKSAVVVNLPIGTALKILAETDNKLRLNGFRAPWYKVSFAAVEGVSTGYVWGGLLALGSFSSSKDKGVMFLYGLADIKIKKGEEYPRATIQIRACKKNKELSRIKIPSVGNRNIYHQFSNYGNRGVKNIEDVLEYSESQEFCGGENPTTVIFWDGKVLHHVTTLYYMGDPPVFAYRKLIYPTDAGGKASRIIVETVEGWYDEEKQEDVIETHKKVAYVWGGRELEEFSVLLDKKTK